MNYKPLLNKNTKFGNMFKNKNRYRLETRKKSGSKFLIFSVISIGIASILVSIGINGKNDRSGNEILSQNFKASVQNISADTPDNSNLLATAGNSTFEQKESIPLELPEIGYRSEVLSPSVSALSAQESPKEKIKLIETAVNENKKTVSTTIHSSEISTVTPTPVTIKTLNKSATNSILKKVAASKTFEIDDKVINQDKKIITLDKNIATPLTTNTKTVIVKSGDSLSAIFNRLSLSAGTLHQIINSSKQAKKLTRIKPGQKLVIHYDDKDKFQSLSYALDRVDTLIISRENAQSTFTSHIDSKEIEIRQQFATGTIKNSLFAAGNKAGLNSSMIMKLAQLFGWDIDFALDIRKGDAFTVLFEEKYINDKKIGYGNIISAEFVNRGKTFKAIRYTDASGHTDYYSEKGLSMRKAFLRTPVQFSRISSRFSKGRKHPVLNRIRAHKGVDYAASRGTPIKSVGDGKVIFKGRKGGYGRVIILQHGSKYTTLYAHMNSYNRNIKRGGRIKQGQIIGYVGSSGLATGPHLHYEFRINGVHRNPLTVPLPSASPIARKYRADFQNTADTLISQLKSRKLETVALKEQ